MNNQSKNYVVELIESVLIPSAFNHVSMRFPSERISRAFLPYCLAPLGDSLILLNRIYKPLGVSNDQQWVDYDSPEYKSLTVPSKGVDLSTLEQVGDGRYFFFKDRTSPFNGRCANRSIYLAKLWLVFRGLGLNHPGLSYQKLHAAAKALGIPAETLCEYPLSGWRSL